MREFDIPVKPYEERLYLRKKVTFYPGMTVLVGCNGSGKSTLMRLMEEQLEDDADALVLKYDDRKDGGSWLMGKFGFYGNITGLSSMILSSEGERILIGIGDFVMKIRRTVMERNPKEVWIFMDAVGSGLSIDGIDEIKDLAGIIKEDLQGRDVYFVVSTNEYEFVSGGVDCIDVTTFRHVLFTGYEDYRQYILKTRKKKDQRMSKREE